MRHWLNSPYQIPDLCYNVFPHLCSLLAFWHHHLCYTESLENATKKKLKPCIILNTKRRLVFSHLQFQHISSFVDIIRIIRQHLSIFFIAGHLWIFYNKKRFLTILLFAFIRKISVKSKKQMPPLRQTGGLYAIQ